MSHRTNFIDRALLYLFSADIEFSLTYEQLGLVSGGARFNLLCVPNTGRIYNVLRERTIGVRGYEAVTGTIVWGEDAALMGEDDVAFANVRASILTDDGQTIDTRYHGVMPTGLGTFRAIAGGADLMGTAARPAEYHLVVTPTYETDSPKYKWLTEEQCIGFGMVQEVDGMFRRVTYDIFAMA